MTRLALHWQILIAIVLAGIAGAVVGAATTDTFTPNVLGAPIVGIFDYLGTLFLNALKMIIVPLITSSIIVGVAGLGSGSDLTRLGGKTLLFYASTTLFAIVVGLFLVNLFTPGIVDGVPARDMLGLDKDQSDVVELVGDGSASDVADIFLRMVPTNVLQAAVDGNLLGLIFFAILFGFFMTRLDNEYAEPLYRFWDGVFHLMMRMTEWIMLFAPIGVFGLIAATVAETGFDALPPLLKFSAIVLVALAIHAFGTLPALLRIVGRVKPYKTMSAMAPAMLTAFSTASSSATLPITIDRVEDEVGVSNAVSSFVLPLGATVNMNGTALYECAAAIFIAQAYGLDLTLGVQFSIVVIALLTSIGVAGVPSASLVAIAIILKAVGLPIEAIGVLLVFDRILDMARTSVNIWGDAACATIIARLSGEKTRVGIEGEEEEAAQTS